MSAGPLQGPHLLVVYMWGPHQVQEDLLTQDPKARVAGRVCIEGLHHLVRPDIHFRQAGGRRARTVLSGELDPGDSHKRVSQPTSLSSCLSATMSPSILVIYSHHHQILVTRDHWGALGYYQTHPAVPFHKIFSHYSFHFSPRSLPHMNTYYHLGQAFIMRKLERKWR